jgi:autotransporter-associated beta strand protein
MSIKPYSLCALLLALSLSTQAATRTWDGQASDGDFASPLNWDGNTTVPTSGDLLQVGPNLGTSPTLAFNTPSGLFDAPSFTFLGTLNTSYTITAATFSDVLNLTGTGETLRNLSTARQTFQVITISLASSQTWNGGGSGLRIAEVDLGANHSLVIDGAGSTPDTRNEILGGLFGQGTSGIVKQGAGTLFLNSAVANDYAGSTTISGGVLTLGASHQIPNASRLTLDGGTFQAAGFDDTMGALSLTNNSTIDFGLGADLAFAPSSGETWSGATLNITNFTAGQNTWRVGSGNGDLSPSQLSHILFNGTTAATIDSAGYVLPVPEPNAAVLLFAGCAFAAAFARSRR